MSKIKSNWKNDSTARFACCLTLSWPMGKSFSSKGIVEGKISPSKRGINGFGYDPIFIPNGYQETFGEMKFNLKISIDHRFKAFNKVKDFFI